MMEAYRHVGIYIPRDTYSMLASSQLIWEHYRDAKKGDLAFFGSGHVEMYVEPGITIGAETFGTTVGYHRWNAWWHPTAFYRVRGARARP